MTLLIPFYFKHILYSIMNNRNRSPLYTYVENKLVDHSVNIIILQKAKDAVDGLVTSCCPTYIKTTNNFLIGFYSLLKTMPKQYSLNKVIAVQSLLAEKIACCTNT